MLLACAPVGAGETTRAMNALQGDTGERVAASELASSRFAMDRHLGAAMQSSLTRFRSAAALSDCAVLLAGAQRPAVRLEAACSRGQSRAVADVRPDAADREAGYYLNCLASSERVRRLRADAGSTSNEGTTPIDPLFRDGATIEFERPDGTVHIEFDGPRRCATRLVIVFAEKR